MNNDGGMAFPGFIYTEGHGQHRKNADGEWEAFSSGMSLRDYFAAKALQGMLAQPVQPQSGADMFARDAYSVADAMISERAKEKS